MFEWIIDKIFDHFITISFLFIIIVLLVIPTVRIVFFTFNDHHIVVEVTGKERVANRAGNGARFMVWGRDINNGEVVTLEITDSLFRWRWDSADVYGRIEVGATYRFTLIGVRFPFLSMFQNILEARREG